MSLPWVSEKLVGSSGVIHRRDCCYQQGSYLVSEGRADLKTRREQLNSHRYRSCYCANTPANMTKACRDSSTPQPVIDVERENVNNWRKSEGS